MKMMSEEHKEYSEESQHVRSRKVDFGVFVWVVSILSGAMLTISSYLFAEMGTLRTELASESARGEGIQKELAARIESEKDKGQLIREVLAEIRVELKNIKDVLDRGARR